ncbi:hypothetical protein HY745_04655 [Candidatus Desantisbacteria bacterium]|nr:hypothetical protein [Candidatus Desantisbacteria bacterium]
MKYITYILLFTLIIPLKLISQEKSAGKKILGIGAWEETASLMEPVANHYSLTVSDKIYVFVGMSIINSHTAIISSEFNEKGIKFWKKPASLFNALEDFGAVSTNNFLYIVGGKSKGFEQGNVTYFAITPDGISTKGIIGAKMPVVLNKPAVTFNKGYLFVSGGKIGSKISNQVFSAMIDTSGMPGKWQELNSLPIGVYDHVMFSYKDYIYISGGYHNAGSVYGAKVNMDGTIEKWTGLNDTPISLEKHAGIVYNDNIFISGGIEDGRTSSFVYQGEFFEEGLVIKWEKAEPLPRPVFNHSMTANDKFLIISGGISGGRVQAKILIAPFIY